MEIKKEKLKNLVEPFIYDDLQLESYKISKINASDLLVWNRFDLAFKLFYLDNKKQNMELARKIYIEDIKAQTVGKFEEKGSKDKSSIEKYIEIFTETYNNIDKIGFDDSKTVIPLSSNGSIINGAHRISSAIHLNKEVSCVHLDLPIMTCDYKYFFERDVSIDILDIVATQFIKYAQNTYVAFLWPSGVGSKKEAESKFSNIVYKKELTLTPNGAFNLLYELYKHMDWIGNAKESYSGIQKKLVECFPNFNSFTVIVFQEESLEKVRDIKEEVRKIYNIGYSSVHITDTKNEAVEISRFLLNDNALHFLNYRNLSKISLVQNELLRFKQFINKNNIDTDNIILDSSIILALYGLRKNNDIDYLLDDTFSIKYIDNNIDANDKTLPFYEKEKYNLIYNPGNYFYFENLKFISFKQLYIMKSNRNKDRDINDCNMMRVLIENNAWKKKKNQLKQSLFYLKIKIKNNIKELIFSFLKMLHLYDVTRNYYLKNIEKSK